MIKNEMMNKSRMFFKPKSNIPAFLVKTYDIIDNPVHFDIISWNKEGNAFVVKNVNDFSEKILPKYFNITTSLLLYANSTFQARWKENEFKHKLFRKGQKHLLADIKRKGSDCAGFGEEQMMAPTSRGAEMTKVKKSANILNDELSTVKSQQQELERMGKMIYSQNTQLLGENKLLWEELNKNKEKYDKKVEKLMMFICAISNQTGNNSIGPSELRKMLPSSENTEIVKNMPLASQEQSTASPQSLQQKENLSPDNRVNPVSVTSYLPEKALENPQNKSMFNAPISSMSNMQNNANGAMMGNPIMTNLFSGPGYQNMYNNAAMQNLPNTYNAHPYFSENSASPNINQQTATTSGNVLRKENPILTRPVSSLDSNDSKEFRENPIKMMKKDSEVNPLQLNIQTSMGAFDDPMKMEEWQMQMPGMSRGTSFNGDLNFQRFNSLNVPRIPSALENNFNQYNPMFIHNLRSNGESLGLYGGKMESEGMQNGVNEDGVPDFSPATFMKNPNNLNGFSFGQPEEGLYTK